MQADDYAAKARQYLQRLCSVKPNRRTGSAGNREATDFFAGTVRPYGYEIEAAPFDCLDYSSGAASLTGGGQAFQVYGSPYSLGCDVRSELLVVSSLEELEAVDGGGRILLIRGELCSEQLMPKKFVFYNPEHHRTLIALLEKQEPAGIIAATERKPEQVGALYPFPLIVDGDFDIPSVYCRDAVGDVLAALQGLPVRLQIQAGRRPSSAANVVARLKAGAAGKIVITAHIDAYEDSPGASDNASGIAVLLLFAEMLSGYSGGHCLEIVALNGEDHYSAGGQLDYLKRYGDELPGVLLAVNIDDVGYRQGRSAYSFYECPAPLENKASSVLRGFDGLTPGERWFNGDHMIFVQKGVPSLAFTSECVPELMRTVTHTSADTPDIIDCRKLVEVAESLCALVRSL